MPCFQLRKQGFLFGEKMKRNLKKSGQVYEIIEADIEEVSLVDRGANFRSFYLVKSLTGGKQMKEFAKAFKELFGVEPTEDLLKATESLDASIRKERTEALQTLAKVSGEFDDETSEALEKLLCNVPVIIKEIEKEKPVLSEEVKKAIEQLNVAAGISPVVATTTVADLVVKSDSNLVEVDLDEMERNAAAEADQIVKSAKARLSGVAK